MADSEEAAPAPRAPPPPPVQVAYCPITGIPPEYNDYLPKDSDEFRKWKASQSAGAGDEAASAVSAGMEGLSVEAKEGEGPAASIPADAAEEKAKPSKKKKATKAVTIEANKRQKNKTTTVVTGLDLFDIKLAEVRGGCPDCYLLSPHPSGSPLSRLPRSSKQSLLVGAQWSRTRRWWSK